LFAATGELRAVLDWEIATLGDPLADFAYALNAWAEPTDPFLPGQDPATAVPGFASRAELAERYAARTGADISLLPYYRSFNYFKTACIIHGVYARYRAGQKSTEGVDLDLLHDRIAVAVDLADELGED
jgi:aminoglycoside phosphotransferase (APT) family kinase protein